MVLYQTIKSEHATILVFKNDSCEKSMVRYVAETIIALGEDPGGVPTEALHYCVPGHPFSSMQRLRELSAAYRRQWPGFTVKEHDSSLPGNDSTITTYASFNNKMFTVHNYPKPFQSHIFRKDSYWFTPEFIAWLRSNIDEIESIVYPVTSKKLRREYMEK